MNSAAEFVLLRERSFLLEQKQKKERKIGEAMYTWLFLRFRYLPLFLLLILSFRLLSITQIGADAWEIPSGIMDKSITINNQMSLLFGIELLFIMLDIILRMRIKKNPIIVYFSSLILSVVVYFYGLGQQLLSLSATRPILSEIISHSLFFGVPITIVIVGYLTFSRVKHAKASS